MKPPVMAMRVVSVLPSATEIVCALGHRADLVARSEECDFPHDVTNLPAVMRARAWDGDRPSGEIDARVQRTRKKGESLYELDIPLLRGLCPELLLTQNLCGVCSVTDEEVAAACASAGVAPTIVSLTPRTLAEVWASIDTVAEALGDPSAGDAVSRALRLRSSKSGASATRPRVAVVEWLDPPILAGLWTPDIVLSGGGIPLRVGAGEPGIRTTWESLRALDPDLVILSPCSFSVARTQRELDNPWVASRVGTLAPRLGTFVADEAYFSRPGPRLADGIDLVRHLLTGDAWDPPMPIFRLPAPPSETAS